MAQGGRQRDLKMIGGSASCGNSEPDNNVGEMNDWRTRPRSPVLRRWQPSGLQLNRSERRSGPPTPALRRPLKGAHPGRCKRV